MADASRDVITRRVPTAMGWLHVVDHAGDEPALVLMHGFPDDSRIYARLVPLLGYPPGRPVPQGGPPPDRRRIPLATVGPTPGGLGVGPMNTLNIKQAGNPLPGQLGPARFNTARLRERSAR